MHIHVSSEDLDFHVFMEDTLNCTLLLCIVYILTEFYPHDKLKSKYRKYKN